MEYRLPYYMAYPMPYLFDDEKIERRDFDYLKSMYPMTVKNLLPYIEEECERMSYEGSVIYDEYPDQLQIRMMCNRIYDKVQRNEPERDFGPELKELIQVLTFHELYRLRCKHRRGYKKFY